MLYEFSKLIQKIVKIVSGNHPPTLIYAHIKCGHTKVKNLRFHPWPFLAQPQRLEKRQWKKKKKNSSEGGLNSGPPACMSAALSILPSGKAY